MRISSPAVALLLSLALPASSSAQSLDRGSRVRVVTSGASQPRVGTVLSATSDSAVIQWENTEIVSRLALADASQLDVSVGRRRHVRSGLVWGLTSGLLVGGLAAAATYEPCEGFCFLEPASRGAAAAWGAGLGGLFGVGIGAIVGGLITTDKWQQTTVQRSVGVISRPTGSGLAMGLAYSF